MSSPADPEIAAVSPQILRRLRLLVGLHLAAAAPAALLASQPLAGVLAALAILYALLLLLLRRPGRALAHGTQRLIHLLVSADLLGLLLFCHLLGGIENPFYPLFVLPVILAAAYLTRAATLGYAALTSLLYGGLLVAERSGLLPHLPLAGFHAEPLHQNGLLIAAQWLALTITVLLAAAVTASLVAALDRRARTLAARNQEAEAQAAAMHQLNTQLRAANTDIAHHRAHLDTAYKELQAAYDRQQVRSAHMSELNEQLRSANAECRRRHEELERLNAELTLANARLREMEDMRARFTLMVTHELRAPVAAIQSYLKLILEGYVPPEKVNETLEKAERRAVEQLAFIADLLELGRISSADARGQARPLQIEQLLREQLDLHAAAAQERGITVHTAIAPDLPAVLANPEQIKSLWNNLIGNAIKYNRAGGHVTITVQQDAGRLAVSVADTGIGIPPEALARIFSEFFRADNAKAVARPGTGLGLAIVKEIVERAGGQITAESELDKGSVFRFWLPACNEQQDADDAD